MLKTSRTMVSLVAASALLAIPAAGQAKHGHNDGKGKGKNRAANCAKAHAVGFQARGTLVSATADNPATPASEATVTLTVDKANRHAKKSGDIADQNAAKKGVQVKGATLTIAAGDAFNLKLRGYDDGAAPAAGDRVKVQGKIALTKRRCATDGTSVADRYGALDVRKVTVSDRD